MSKDEIQVDDQVIDAVAKKATEAIKSEISIPSADEIAEKLAEKTAEKTEKTVKKNIGDEGDDKAEKRVQVKGVDSLSKEMRFAKGLIAERTGDRAGVVEYNTYSLKQWTQKADYQNVGTNVDGGSLVPDPEFMAEVDRLTREYGVVARLANVRSTNRDSVTLLKGTNEVSFTKVGEATAVNAQKLTYGSETVSLDKYMLTLILTSEITEDSAINIWQDATNEIARARAKLFDELVFTDATYGLLSAVPGDEYKAHTVGAALSDFSFDDAMDSTLKVVSSARRNGKFFMHPTVWNQLRQSKSGDGSNSAANYYAGGPLSAPTPVIDGYPVELVDIMPDSGDITANEAFAVFGDMGRIMIHVKRALETKTFDTGIIKDAGGNDFNLLTQDSYGMRATMRVVPQTRFQGAFTIIGTGSVS